MSIGKDWTESLMNRTEPSLNDVFTPPEWKLEAAWSGTHHHPALAIWSLNWRWAFGGKLVSYWAFDHQPECHQ